MAETTIKLTDEQKNEITAAVIKAVLEQSEPIQDFERVTTASKGLSIPFVDEDGKPKVADISAILQNSQYSVSVERTGKHNNVIKDITADTASASMTLTLGDMDADTVTYSGANLSDELDKLEMAVWLRVPVSLKAVMAATEDGNPLVIKDDGTVMEKGRMDEMFSTVPVCAQVVISDTQSEWALISATYIGEATIIDFSLKDYTFNIMRSADTGSGRSYVATWSKKTEEEKQQSGNYDGNKIYEALFAIPKTDEHIKEIARQVSPSSAVSDVTVDGVSVVQNGVAKVSTVFSPSVDGSIAMPKDIGGLKQGTTAAYLGTMNVDQLLSSLLFPDISPKNINATFTFTVGSWSVDNDSTKYVTLHYGDALPTERDCPADKITPAKYSWEGISKQTVWGGQGGEPVYTPAAMPTGTAKGRGYDYTATITFAAAKSYMKTSNGNNSGSTYGGETVKRSIHVSVLYPVYAWLVTDGNAPTTTPSKNLFSNAWVTKASNTNTGKTNETAQCTLYVAAPFPNFKVSTVTTHYANNSTGSVALAAAGTITGADGLTYTLYKSTKSNLEVTGAYFTIPMSSNEMS